MNEPVYNIGSMNDNMYDDEDQDDLLRAEEQFAEDMQAGLSDDAPWKRIQQNTFTRWANEHLKAVNRQLIDLQYDLSDGLMLIALIEILSGKKLPKHNKKTTFRSQKLENVSVALDFLENVEQIKLVNIDASHIVDGRLKLILGLIWTLILHYYISLPRWETTPVEDQKPGREPTPKQKLMGWVKNMLPPDLPITNFTTDWNNGRAIGALVDACAPGLYPDWVENDPRDALKNTKEAMDLADEWLGIPQLIRPEEMIDPNVDDRSMMTYLSQYPGAKLKPGAPIKPMLNAALARCYGKGIEPVGNFVGEPTEFFVETKQAGVGKLNVILINPSGKQEKCDITLLNDPNRTFSCVYTPTMEGQYKAIVKYANQEVPNSPFSPYIDRHPSDANACRAYGPGLEGEVTVDKPTWFEVNHADAGPGRLEGSIVDPIYRQETPISIKPIDAGKSRGEYVPRSHGPHKLSLTYDGQPIPGTPFNVDVVSDEDSISFQAFGPGLAPTGVKVNDTSDFKVVANAIPKENINVNVISPDGFAIPCSVKKINAQSFNCSYIPKQPGPHKVLITYLGKHISQSPYNVMVSDIPKDNVRAYGPGLEKGTVRQPADFVVETSGSPKDLSFSIEGPDKVELNCRDNHDGTVNVSYIPVAPGEHDIHVLNKNVDIPGSPFTAHITAKEPMYSAKQHPATQSAIPSTVRVYGPGVEPGVRVDSPTHFIVDCKEAGPGDVSVAVNDPHGRDVKLKIDPLDNAFRVGYTPTVSGPHTITVLHDNVEIAQSPIVVDVMPAFIDVSKIYPEEINQHPIVNQPNLIKMNTQQAGPVDVKDVDAIVSPLNQDRQSQPIKANVTPTDTGYGINYSVPSPGVYDVCSAVNGMPVKPVRIEAVDAINPSRVRVYGPGLSEGIVNMPTHFTVDTSDAGPGELRVAIEGPSKPILSRDDDRDDLCKVTYTPTAPGEHTINVLFDNKPVPGSPFHPKIYQHPDSMHIHAYGPGIDPVTGVNVGCQTEFTVDSRPFDHTGTGDVRCSVLSPSGSQVTAQVDNNRDGTYSVKYTPVDKGPLNVDVRYNGVPIPSSPFPVNSSDSKFPSGKVHCYGPGLENAYTNEPAEFTIDTTNAGQGQLNVTIQGPGDAPLIMKNKVDGLCLIEYVPSKPGPYEISITFNDQPISSYPFSVNVEDRVSENAVHISMPDEPLCVNVPFEMTIDGRQAGPGLPTASVVNPYGVSQPMSIRAVSSDVSPFSKKSPTSGGKYIADYIPSSPGVHQFNVNWSGRPVSGSPFNIQALPKFDVNKVTVDGPGISTNVPASVPTQFNIDTHSKSKDRLDILIRAPDDQLIKNVIDDHQDGTYTVHYMPTDTGIYTISVICGSKHIPKSPFSVNVVSSGDASKCRINGNGIRTNVPVGEQCIIHVDATDAGAGSVTATIVNQLGIPLEFDLVDTKMGTFDIVYMPTTEGIYTIKIYFGGELIPHGTFVVKAGGRDAMYPVDGIAKPLSSPSYSQPIDFRIPTRGSISDITAEIKTPSQRIVTPIIEDNNDGTMSIKYHPTEVGEHILNVYYQGVPVQGSPYRFTVDQMVDGYVTAYGPGLSSGISGEPCHFKIVTKDAGTGSLAVAVEGPSKAEIRCKDNKDGTCDATYWPAAPGDYVVTVKYGGKHIAGSPFHVKILDADKRHIIPSVTTSTSKHINVADASRVRAYGSGLEEGYVNVANEFIVDSRNAGNGPLAIAVEGPSKANIECPNNDDGTCYVSYKVSEPGKYIISVKFAESPVPGSPFHVNVYGPGGSSSISSQQHKPITIQQPGRKPLDSSSDSMYKSLIVSDTSSQGVQMHSAAPTAASRIGSACQLCIPIPGVSSKDLIATVTSPSSQSKPCEIADIDSQCKSIRFIPTEVGLHLVNIKRNGQHITGSPYQFTVGPLIKGGAHDVRVSGPGISRGVANIPCEFNVYTRDAGAGALAITVEGPMNAEINFRDVQDGNGIVSYTCPGPGDYSVVVKFNDEHVPGSPFAVRIEPNSSDAKRITIEDIQMPDSKQLPKVNSPVVLLFGPKHGIMPSSKVEALVKNPSLQNEYCDVYTIKEHDRDCYRISFVPKEPGIHKMYVKCDGREIADSPFDIYVSPASKTDSAKVIVTGRGLQSGIVGQRSEFFVDTSQAGTGLLAVVVDGPSKVQLDCKETTGGYNVSFLATAPGEYTISIKFAGNTIVGSPYTCRIIDSQDSLARSFAGTHIDSGYKGAFSDVDRYSLSDRSRICSNTSSVSRQYVSSYSGKSTARNANLLSQRHTGKPHTLNINNIGTTGWTYADAGGIHHGGSGTGSCGDTHSEPQKVRTYGIGIVKAKRNEQTEFTVDATEAGHNMLMVGILGPTRPCEEVLVKHVGKNVYTVSYIVREKGSYVLIVKWGDSHIPGSPFYIEVP